MRIESLGIGGLIAVVVLLLCIVFAVLGQLDLVVAALIGCLAVARLT